MTYNRCDVVVDSVIPAFDATIIEYALSSSVLIGEGSTASGSDHVTPASSDQSTARCSPLWPSGKVFVVMVHTHRLLVALSVVVLLMMVQYGWSK